MPLPAASAEGAAYRYKPSKTVLSGTLELQTFPGRPGYESIAHGDTAERQWYLRLLTPIDVNASSNDEISDYERETHVKIVQLIVIDESAWGKHSSGERVKIEGYLSHRLTGHHHARVLLEVVNTHGES